jgi:hemolysin III
VPRLRGVLHAVAAPLVALAGGGLLWAASGPVEIIIALVFTATAVHLFGFSALYHRGRWTPQVKALLQRLDHANIFILIAGSYTPFAVLLLPAHQSSRLLTLVWAGALLGAALRLSWVQAPRWLFVPLYLVLGWAAVAYLPAFASSGSLIVSLILVGGVLYTVGAVIFATKRPRLRPTLFGFHELFHACTVVAFAAHYVAALLVLLR